MEENQIYELFEDLLKQVLVQRPDNPLEFLLHKIKQNQGKSTSIPSEPKSKFEFLRL